MDSRADVAVRVGSGVVAVQVEQPVVLVLVVVTAHVQHNPGGVVVAVVVRKQNARPLVWRPVVYSVNKNFYSRGLDRPLLLRNSPPTGCAC